MLRTAVFLLLCRGIAQGTTLTPLLGPPADFAASRAISATAPYAPGMHLAAHQPHPAVARIVVPESGATSYGSGTLIDVRDQFGLVVTNWHVVRDGQGDVEVIFPDGFRSKARPLKVDADWDLAALVVWRPPAAPVAIAPHAPQPGDQLTICGYGSGDYRAATGRCTQYYAPREDFPQHMVELDVEARQGDSGGPIFNERGELAGVLFGAGSGTTLGSFGGRVGSFLATLAPDIGRRADQALVERDGQAPAILTPLENAAMEIDRPRPAEALANGNVEPTGKEATTEAPTAVAGQGWDAVAAVSAGTADSSVHSAAWQAASKTPAGAQTAQKTTVLSEFGWFEHAKTVLAIIGAAAVLMQTMRVLG